MGVRVGQRGAYTVQTHLTECGLLAGPVRANMEIAPLGLWSSEWHSAGGVGGASIVMTPHPHPEKRLLLLLAEGRCRVPRGWLEAAFACMGPSCVHLAGSPHAHPSLGAEP